MKKAEMAKLLARQAGVSKAEAADQLDHAVHQILTKLRRGQTAPFPGLGRFKVDPKGVLQFEKEKRRGRGGK